MSEETIRDAAWIVLDLEMAYTWRIEHYEDEKAIQFQDRWLSAFVDVKSTSGESTTRRPHRVGDTITVGGGNITPETQYW